MSGKRLVLAACALSAVALPATAVAAAAPTIGVGSNPNAVVVSANQNRAYVANDGSVSVVNTNTHTQLSETSTTVNHGQTAIGLFRSGTKVYIGDFALKTMVVFNPNTLAVRAGIRIGMGATDMTGASNGTAYISEFGKGGAVGRIVMVNTSTDTRTKTITLKAGVASVTTTPDNKFVWAGSVNSGQIWVVNTKTNTIVRRLNASKSGPIGGIALSPDGTQAWVSGVAGVSVINRSTGKLVKFIPVLTVFPNDPAPQSTDILFNSSGTQALVLDSTDPGNPAAGSVSAINASTFQVTSAATLGTEPTAMAINPATNEVFATNYQDDTLSYFTAP